MKCSMYLLRLSARASFPAVDLTSQRGGTTPPSPRPPRRAREEEAGARARRDALAARQEPLHVRGVEVAPLDDDEVFQPAGDVDLAVADEAEVAGLEPAAVRS